MSKTLIDAEHTSLYINTCAVHSHFSFNLEAEFISQICITWTYEEVSLHYKFFSDSLIYLKVMQILIHLSSLICISYNSLSLVCYCCCISVLYYSSRQSAGSKQWLPVFHNDLLKKWWWRVANVLGMMYECSENVWCDVCQRTVMKAVWMFLVVDAYCYKDIISRSWISWLACVCLVSCCIFWCQNTSKGRENGERKGISVSTMFGVSFTCCTYFHCLYFCEGCLVSCFQQFEDSLLFLNVTT